MRPPKLTPAQVREIRRRYEAHKAGRPKVMAREFGVSFSTIAKIIYRERRVDV